MKTKTQFVNVNPQDLSPAAAGFRCLLEVILGQKVFVKQEKQPRTAKAHETRVHA